MGRWSYKRFALNLISVLLIAATLTVVPLRTYALGVSAGIPIRQTFATDLIGVGETFRYILEGVTPGAPMPAGSIGNKHQIVLEGNERVQLNLFPEHYGQYDYKLYQYVYHSRSNYQYDMTEYRISLYVLDDDYGKPMAVVLVYNEKSEKAAYASFANRYVSPTEPPESTEATEPSKPTEAAKPSGSASKPSGSSGNKGWFSNPKTGDVSPVMVAVITMLTSAGGIFLLLILGRKRKEEDDEENQKTAKRS